MMSEIIAIKRIEGLISDEYYICYICRKGFGDTPSIFYTKKICVHCSVEVREIERVKREDKALQEAFQEVREKCIKSDEDDSCC